MTGSKGVLLVLDGWGEGPPGSDNALAAANTPVLDRLRSQYPGPLLAASGSAVGLPEGVVGNSEIGHLVMGAGRPLEYDSLLVQRQAESGELRTHPELRRVCQGLAERGGALHLVGLCSDGRIHSDIAHFGELLHGAQASGCPRVWLHAVTDGRDVADGTAVDYLAQLQKMADEADAGEYATVIGRNLAMDKSGRRELTERACWLIVDAQEARAGHDAVSAVAGSASDGDIPPTVIRDYPGVRAGDALLFANFRSDRTSPLVGAVHDRLTQSGRADVELLSLAEYDTRARVTALVHRTDASGGLADALEAARARSVRIAEPEKFEHVTFFINGRDARRRPYEEHIQVPGTAGADYTSRPDMNVAQVADRVIEAAGRDDVPLVIANLANIDVVGHTGDYAATVKAAEATDLAVERICAAAREQGRWVLLVGDHGNAEQMAKTGPDGSRRPYGGHTHNPVPCVLVPSAGQRLVTRLPDTSETLPSVAPTVLDLLGIPIPVTISAPSLLSTSGRTETKD
ncbi:2,3-bisphosphoglycerate-independent phosphoglycerate mutase [Streptomyces sp. WMMC1477]|uniref:2,3-bisphosphoglycerate-independent phosphoglycerate mutase n=1 Tax=Streptomyces sp. WMMC1477 TaxID=3015155 RepID=UPI0022B62CF0|nr:2,3-bisphosphoglycerate-independent phosphoglycerate mutase [Streptomyces sp. WMMC1477]MCZ7431125.1 2,3-bisphosphoglycerate-independent phosphoglycerate mutase [Streptomyces sp. WMMC1477]